MINYETMKQHLLHKIAEYDKQIEEINALDDPDVMYSTNKLKAACFEFKKGAVKDVLDWVEKHNN